MKHPIKNVQFALYPIVSVIRKMKLYALSNQNSLIVKPWREFRYDRVSLALARTELRAGLRVAFLNTPRKNYRNPRFLAKLFSAVTCQVGV